MGGHLGRGGGDGEGAQTAHMGWEPEASRAGWGLGGRCTTSARSQSLTQVLLKRGPLTDDERRALQRRTR